jgi:2-succinyl-6-hydroxy-2,4-cyclohexadiene-1-carboxylate synthase
VKTHPVVFLHGFLGERGDWDAVIQRLGRPAIAFDLPGHGDAVSDRAIPEFNALIEGLGAMIPSPAHLVGYSMGGRIAMHIALRFPERVSSLVVISASPGIENETQRAMRRESDTAWANKLRKMERRDFLREWYAQPVFASLRDKPEQLAAIIERRITGDAGLLADALVKWGQGTVPSLWRVPLDVPRQWIFGEKDVAYTKMAGDPENPLPGNIHIIKIIKDAGHTVHLEQPAAVADSIRRFIEELES